MSFNAGAIVYDFIGHEFDYSDRDGSSIGATLYHPLDLAVDPSGNLYWSEASATIRMLVAATQQVGNAGQPGMPVVLANLLPDPPIYSDPDNSRTALQLWFYGRSVKCGHIQQPNRSGLPSV